MQKLYKKNIAYVNLLLGKIDLCKSCIKKISLM